MTPQMLFDYLGVRLNGEKAAGKKLTLNVDFTDLKEKYALTVENGVLDYAPRFSSEPDATMTLTKPTLARIQLGEITLDEAIEAGDAKVDGRKEAIGEFFGMLDTFDFWFNISRPDRGRGHDDRTKPGRRRRGGGQPAAALAWSPSPESTSRRRIRARGG
jgi:alkyl sulfatase BDS1-like metallo-beta-lactamase superfamily hydrolase